MNMINSASAIAGASVTPAAAYRDDPVSKAIEHYLQAHEHFSACIDKADAILEGLKAKASAVADIKMRTRLAFEAANPDHSFSTTQEEMHNWFRVNELRRLKEETSEGREADKIEEEGSRAATEAACALAKTIPQTVDQALALAAFFRQRDEEGDDIVMTYAHDDSGDILLCAVVLDSVAAFLRSQLS